ncbi:DUF1996 domain-containing protein [Streptomyces sp. NPDC059917]|uniref:DUF1996 domain-containing protein n=1 Tax=Streptomyces sp. NPDC059917 TaxID=3347002 RepID=UPI0036576C29
MFAGDPDPEVRSLASPTIVCPDLTEPLSQVPEGAQRAVDENSALLDVQIAGAFNRIQQTGGGPDQAKSALAELSVQRAATLGTMEEAFRRVSSTPPNLRAFATCQIKADAEPDQSIVALAGPGGKKGNNNGQGQGLSRRDFADITQAPPKTGQARPQRNASTGTFTVDCGRNENGHFNSDNVIVAPGVANGAHHMHDYVGNDSTDAQSVNRTLIAAGTTCKNGDKSTHYWPVLRVLDGSRERDAKAPGGGQDKNVGRILTPATVTLKLDGSATAQVTAMPQFMRLITGDAKAFTNGTKNARASWSCTGFENRQLQNKYPTCPQGAQVVRALEFPSCWDGKNKDSANHRTHVVFPDGSGNCRRGFQAIPKLTQRLTYNVPADSFFAVDSFPEQLHKAVTDHGDFINVMSARQMDQAVRCINSGQRCNN